MAKKIIRNKDKGILFWITGLSGSGKTTIAKKNKKENFSLVWSNYRAKWK